MITTHEEREHIKRDLALSNAELPTVVEVTELLDGIQFLSPEQEQQYRDTIAQIGSSLEMLRDEIHMPWNLVNRKRINELATQVAELVPEWTVNDTFLVGTFLAASARAQLVQEARSRGQEIPDQVSVAQNLAALAASANENLVNENRGLHEQIEQADEIGKMAKRIVAGFVPPNLLLQEALKYANARGL
jgi:hypothetical protein